MNKRNINFDRFTTACANARPVGSSISDRNFAHQVKEYYELLTEIETSEATKTISVTPTEPTYDYLYAKDVAVLLNIGMSKAYELIAQANEKLKSKGKYIIPGRVPRKLFMEQLY